MFAHKEDLNNNIYQYQTDQITDGDDTIVWHALEVATQEVRSYLETNAKKEHLDGRKIYDAEAIFAAQDQERNALILQHVLTVAKWYIVELGNADIIYEQAKTRYDRSIAFLEKLQSGELTLSSLPEKDSEHTTEEESSHRNPFILGSRTKFNHE